MNKLDKSAGGTIKPCVRMKLIKRYRKEINEKTYKIKSKEIATKMARELFNGKSPTSRMNFKS